MLNNFNISLKMIYFLVKWVSDGLVLILDLIIFYGTITLCFINTGTRIKIQIRKTDYHNDIMAYYWLIFYVTFAQKILKINDKS